MDYAEFADMVRMGVRSAQRIAAEAAEAEARASGGGPGADEVADSFGHLAGLSVAELRDVEQLSVER